MDAAKKKLLHCISKAQFALIECSMFLDTHPHDKAALEKREFFMKNLKALMKEYEEKYGPLTLATDFGNESFDWIKDPWPWEKEAN